ncbi:thioredoxin family protein [Xanthomonas euvesicatoria]|uniref:thioredoxin family protein n=1 Tax=Xanthomonas euvesicatoria TaxID=456327 RepID=UPI000AC19B32|nr:thioredoxin family protein [Xanthomonas euvesicatoria]
MGFVRQYASQAPERSAVEAQTGLQVLEFGTDWCGHCIAAQPLLQKLLGGYEAIDYRKIEDRHEGALAQRIPVAAGIRWGHGD